jgi:hypothetical protein
METSKLEYVNISPYSGNWLGDGWGSLPDCDSKERTFKGNASNVICNLQKPANTETIFVGMACKGK